MARKTGSHSDITGPKVREAAQRLFARYGFAAVSMRQIAAEVGVQAGALYLYTSDKQTLLSELMRDHMTTLLAAQAALPELPSPSQRLDQFARFHVGYHVDRPDAVFIAYMELRNLSPGNFAAVEALRRQYEDGLRAILEDGIATGEFAVDDARLTTMALIAMLTGVANWYREGGRLGRADVEAQYAKMALRLVTPG